MKILKGSQLRVTSQSSGPHKPYISIKVNVKIHIHDNYIIYGEYKSYRTWQGLKRGSGKTRKSKMGT